MSCYLWDLSLETKLRFWLPPCWLQLCMRTKSSTKPMPYMLNFEKCKYSQNILSSEDTSSTTRGKDETITEMSTNIDNNSTWVRGEMDLHTQRKLPLHCLGVITSSWVSCSFSLIKSYNFVNLHNWSFRYKKMLDTSKYKIWRSLCKPVIVFYLHAFQCRCTSKYNALCIFFLITPT